MTKKFVDDVIRPWETLSEDVLFETERLKLTRETVRIQSGEVIDDYYQIHMGHSTGIAATRPDGRVILMRMYKHGARRHGLAFPGGGVERGEAPMAAAQRELLEETGYGGGQWTALGDYAVHSNQGCGHVHFFQARDVTDLMRAKAGDLEAYDLVFMTRDEVKRAIGTKEFLSMGNVCMAVLWLTAADA